MNLQQEFDESLSFIECDEKDANYLLHQKKIRQRIEDRLELKRLKQELEYFDGELDGDFDWQHR